MLIFSIAIGAEYLSYVISIATFAPTFYGDIISVLANMNMMTDFHELRVQYMKIPRSEHVENILRTFCVYKLFFFDIQNNVLNILLAIFML